MSALVLRRRKVLTVFFHVGCKTENDAMRIADVVTDAIENRGVDEKESAKRAIDLNKILADVVARVLDDDDDDESDDDDEEEERAR